jgi:hypothetical protein
MCSGCEACSYLRLTDACVTRLDSNKEEREKDLLFALFLLLGNLEVLLGLLLQPRHALHLLGVEG